MPTLTESLTPYLGGKRAAGAFNRLEHLRADAERRGDDVSRVAAERLRADLAALLVAAARREGDAREEGRRDALRDF
jgi:hypothetical protein